MADLSQLTDQQLQALKQAHSDNLSGEQLNTLVDMFLDQNAKAKAMADPRNAPGPAPVPIPYTLDPRSKHLTADVPLSTADETYDQRQKRLAGINTSND